MKTMTTDSGCSIMQDAKNNRIIINLPQTANTITSKLENVGERKVELANHEALLFMTLTINFMEEE